MMKRMIAGLIGMGLLANAMPAFAAVKLNVDRSGTLTGATGVVIGKNTYNVDFFDNSCTVVFGTCSASKFDFKTDVTARDAASALLNQVYTTANVKTYSRVLGCEAGICDSYIPYQLFAGDPSYALAIVAAYRGTDRKFVGAGPAYPEINTSTTADSSVNYVRFTMQTVAAVPEPATWAMMLVGFGMVGAASRSRRRSTATTFA